MCSLKSCGMRSLVCGVRCAGSRFAEPFPHRHIFRPPSPVSARGAKCSAVHMFVYAYTRKRTLVVLDFSTGLDVEERLCYFHRLPRSLQLLPTRTLSPPRYELSTREH